MQPTGASAETGTAPAPLGDVRARPFLWRLPLFVFFVIGAICLKYLDGRLAADYRNLAEVQVARTGTLLERSIEHRASLLRTLAVLVEESPTERESSARFAALAERMVESEEAVRRVYLLGPDGGVREAMPRGTDDDLASTNHLLLAELADALVRAQQTRAPATTGIIPLNPDTLGFVIYDPVVRRGRVEGFVATSVVHADLLRQSFAGRSRGSFGYRLVDSAGTVLAISERFPSRVSGYAHEPVSLPGGAPWSLQLAIEPLEPLVARATLWAVGIALLLVVFLLVVREDARAERIAQHSFNLELLSRHLLDANMRIEERAQEVAEANRAKSRFLANVSHELRTPLNAIVGYNALALSGLYGEVAGALREAHERIRASAEHLLGLVNDVLDLSKIEVGRMEVELRPVDLEAVLSDVVAVVEPAADAKGVRIDVVVARDLPLVTTDPRHARQILLNLVSNAVKFTEQGAVTVVARRAEANREIVRVEVEDTGVGIPSGDLKRIFEEFEQVRPDGRGDSLVRGVGLGLTLARKLARHLGGDVTATSVVGEGSRFALELPVHATVRVQPADPADRDEREAGRVAAERELGLRVHSEPERRTGEHEVRDDPPPPPRASLGDQPGSDR